MEVFLEEVVREPPDFNLVRRILALQLRIPGEAYGYTQYALVASGFELNHTCESTIRNIKPFCGVEKLGMRGENCARFIARP